MNKINKIETTSDTENILTAVRGEGLGELGDKGEEIKENKQITTTDSDNSMVITRGKWKWRDVEEGKGRVKGDGRRVDLGW